LRAGILDLIAGDPRGSSRPESFEQLALRVFAYQYARNAAYRRYCERRKVTPETVQRWQAIPPVPTAAFKEAALICGDRSDAEAVFRTSGTTQGAEKRGAHYVRDLGLYEAAALPNFREHLLPDRARLPMLILGPSPELAPDSSLTWMMERVRVAFAGDTSGYFVDADGLRLEPLLDELDRSEGRGAPIMMLGTAAAVAHLLDSLEGRGLRFSLPPGSRLMETGGFKRQRREIPREEFYARLTTVLALSEHYCVAEYGMTELCSQFYDNVLKEWARGRPVELRHKVVPHWVRTQVVDAESLEPLPEGTVGVLRHYDLANLDSVMAVQTDDLGVATTEGFEIIGRATGSELRGCSLAMDQWLTAQR